MNIELLKVNKEDKEKLFRLLQFALYDGSQYIKNEINSECLFDYKWFDNYFLDADREAYFIMCDNKIVGFVMINENLKVVDSGHSIAEFLILPTYRRSHIGKTAANLVFDLFAGNWEVEPIANSDSAYKFWLNVIKDRTNNNFEIKDSIFLFKN